MRDLQASLPRRRDGDRTELEPQEPPPSGGFEAQLSPPLTAVPPQVLRDYLQGKLLVSPQANTQLARLAALQHRSQTQGDRLSE